jgi:NDP-sugar pyrophosphorylase family protein
VPLHTAVIPAAGMGTRFLPATKAVPKELMPIFDTPALQLVMDEAIGAGCDHIVVVSSKAKTGIEAYLAPSPDAVKRVRDSGRTELADRLARIGSDVRVSQVGSWQRTVCCVVTRRTDGRFFAAETDVRHVFTKRQERCWLEASGNDRSVGLWMCQNNFRTNRKRGSNRH